jgi:hypothetical protein
MLTVQNISELSNDEIVVAENLLKDFMLQYRPDIDTSPASVFYQMIIRPAAYFYAVNQENSRRLLTGNSLKVVTENPDLADPETFDNLLSNYFITRSEGAKASGKLRIVLSENRYTAVSTNTLFSVNGMTFSPTRTFIGVTSESQIVTGNEVLIAAFGNKYSFTIDVVCNSAGVGGNVKQSTIFASNLIQTYISTIYADEDFSGGKNVETNTELLLRLRTGIANRNLSGRPAIKAAIQNTYPSVRDVSVIGANDIEMNRDKRNALGVASFGKVDIYLRTNPAPLSVTIDKKATLVSANTWIMTFTRDEYPGMYRVESVVEKGSPVNTSSYRLLTVTRAADVTEVTGNDYVSNVNATDAIFSRYQTYSTTFSADSTDYSIGDEKEFSVTVCYMPNIANIHDYFSTRQLRVPGADYLYKASIPCFVAMSLNIVKGYDNEDVDTDSIKSTITEAVNALDYQQNGVSRDYLFEKVRSVIPRRAKVKSIEMRGELLLPVPEINYSSNDYNYNGSYWIFNNEELVAPVIPNKCVSSRTVAFFAAENRIAVNVLSSDQLIV